MFLFKCNGEALYSSYFHYNTYTLNKASINRLWKQIQKLANAAQVSFPELALLRDQNQFLMEMNNKAKVRRSTRSIVLGTAKVISFKDIKEARAKRAAKDALKGKGKRGRKRKSAAVEADEPEPEVAQMIEAWPWRAPVARMI